VTPLLPGHSQDSTVSQAAGGWVHLVRLTAAVATASWWRRLAASRIADWQSVGPRLLRAVAD